MDQEKEETKNDRADDRNSGTIPARLPPTPGVNQPQGYVPSPKPAPVLMGYTPDHKPIPHPPIVLEDYEKLLDYKKPKFRAYTPAVFGFCFGLVLWFLFTVGLGGAGCFGGIILWALLMIIIFFKFYKKTGYWFTSERIVIHDGSKIMIVPYNEIALSSISFEKDSAMFHTIYNKEFVLKGVENIENMIRFITKNIKENQ